MVKKIAVLTMGLALLALVVWLGFRASEDNTYILFFGLASAILAPLGITVISYAFSGRERETLQRLEKVPEIAKLIEQAKTQEEKIRVLEQQRDQLTQIIQLESRRQALLATKESLEARGVDILEQLDAVEAELPILEASITSSPASEHIQRLHERLQARRRGDLVIRIGSRYYSLDRDLILSVPMGRFLLGYLRMMQSLFKRTQRRT